MKLSTHILRFSLTCLLLVLAPFAWALDGGSEFEGVWIRKLPASQDFDPFLPNFVIIERIEKNFLVIFVNSVIEGDRVVAESIHHLYREEAATLINRGARLSSVSSLSITDAGELVEVIEVSEIGESGQNFYVRPDLADFQAMIDWYGYDLQ